MHRPFVPIRPIRLWKPDIEDVLFVVGESGTTYELKLFTSDNPDQTIFIYYFPKVLQVQAEWARQVRALDLMRSIMRGLPVDGYEIIKAEKKQVYRDAYFSMKFVELDESSCDSIGALTHFTKLLSRYPSTSSG